MLKIQSWKLFTIHFPTEAFVFQALIQWNFSQVLNTLCAVCFLYVSSHQTIDTNFHSFYDFFILIFISFSDTELSSLSHVGKFQVLFFLFSMLLIGSFTSQLTVTLIDFLILPWQHNFFVVCLESPQISKNVDSKKLFIISPFAIHVG